MICKKCRTEAESGALTCPSCGSLLETSSEEAKQIFEDIKTDSAPIAEAAARELGKKTSEAVQDLENILSIKKHAENIAAAQSIPIRTILKKLNSASAEEKRDGEISLYSANALYGGNTAYMQNTRIEITNLRLKFYERLFTNSGIMDIVTAFLPLSYSFSIDLADIKNAQAYEINYNPGLKLSLRENYKIYLQCENNYDFTKILMQALDAYKLSTER